MAGIAVREQGDWLVADSDEPADHLEALFLNVFGPWDDQASRSFHKLENGVYTRETHALAGFIFVGRKYKKEHIFRVLTGKIAFIDLVTGKVAEVSAPFECAAAPGRKVGVIVEDCIMQCIHTTDKLNLLEAEFDLFEQSSAYDAAVRRYL